MKPELSTKPLLYSYIRFSTLEQARGHSLSRQMSYAKEVARERGLELDESLTMKDLGLSAFHMTNVTRGALGMFLEAVEQGKVPPGSILVIESLDRISRAAPLDSQGIIAQIINADITVITAVDRKEYNKQIIKRNPMDLVSIILILIRAHEESETKSTRVRSVLVKQCEDWLGGKRGFRVKCGKPPKWVKWSDGEKKFVFVPREKKVIQRKIELFRKGFGGLKIAELLNAEFGAGTVHHTGANVYKEVKRRTLIGELNISVGDTDYVLEDYYPPILTQGEFDQVVADSSKRGAIKYSQKFVGILSGIDVFKCGCCGKSVGSHVIYRKKCLEEVKSSHKRYGCVEARRNNGCDMKSTIQIDVVEKAVVTFCKDKVNLKRLLLSVGKRDSYLAEELELKNKLKEVDIKIDRLTEVLTDLGEESPLSIAKKIRMLEKDHQDLNMKLQLTKNEIAKAQNQFRDDVSERWSSLTRNISNLSRDSRLELRQLIKDTFKSITLNSSVDESTLLTGIDSTIDSKLFGGDSQNCFELTLEFHNKNKRLLRLDKHTGKLQIGLDLN